MIEEREGKERKAEKVLSLVFPAEHSYTILPLLFKQQRHQEQLLCLVSVKYEPLIFAR